ncbi:peptidyl-tRNA hydrolase [Gordonia sp. CPCC 205333]|uniref:peptidyl-tRNA hydrolase n=1 Tax=Gordonia sp. CPCC 205333 TaxID=3140790 RepID=UPI003AF39B0B
MGQFDDAYQRLRDYVGGADDYDDPAKVLAMAMVLRIEKTDPPGRAELLIAAARAVVLLCLDERSGGDGPWAAELDAWCAARIRKIARRARTSHWQAAQQVWGITASHGTAQARAFVPGRVGDVDPRIKRLQIGGTEVDGELPSTPDGSVGTLVLWINPALEMTVGKLAAQVGHGAMLGVKLMSLEQARAWHQGGCPIEVCAPEQAIWARLLDAESRGTMVAVRDAGFTEIAPGSVTVIAQWPSEPDSVPSPLPSRPLASGKSSE